MSASPTNLRTFEGDALIADLGDLHVNSTTGLLARRVQLDDGGYYWPSRVQAWIWRCYQDFIVQTAAVKKRLGVPLWVLLKGELADLNKHRTTQLITRNEIDVINMAVDCLAPLVGLADYVIVLRGTEAHVGASGWLDEAVARALRDRILGDRLVDDGRTGLASHFVWRGVIGGLRIHAAHHPGASSRTPHTRGNEANRTAARIFYEYSKVNVRQQRAGRELIGWPDLALFGHNHWPADSRDHHPVRAIITPSWQLNTAFGYKLGGDLMPVGGNLIRCKGPGRYDVHPVHYFEPLDGFNVQGEREP